MQRTGETINRRKSKSREIPEVNHVRLLGIDDIRPSPENDLIYNPLPDDDPATIALRDSIRQHGILGPLVISSDGFILSGHRRHRAARLAGLLELPVRVEDIARVDDVNAFMVRLREHNRQRDKGRDEVLREELLTVDPSEAYQSLVQHRQRSSRVETSTIELREHRKRKAISPAKQAMLQVALNAINELQPFWPISLRVVHCKLLNNPPLRHSGKSTKGRWNQCSRKLVPTWNRSFATSIRSERGEVVSDTDQKIGRPNPDRRRHRHHDFSEDFRWRNEGSHRMPETHPHSAG